MSNRPIEVFTFQDSVNASQDGEILSVNTGSRTVNIEVTSTSTDAVVNFEAQFTSDTWHPVNGIDIETFNLFTSISTSGVYQVDLTGVKKLRCRLSDITNGEVSVVGKVVS